MLQIHLDHTSYVFFFSQIGCLAKIKEITLPLIRKGKMKICAFPKDIRLMENGTINVHYKILEIILTTLIISNSSYFHNFPSTRPFFYLIRIQS